MFVNFFVLVGVWSERERESERESVSKIVCVCEIGVQILRSITSI